MTSDKLMNSKAGFSFVDPLLELANLYHSISILDFVPLILTFALSLSSKWYNLLIMAILSTDKLVDCM
jgi:hypothetical protein